MKNRSQSVNNRIKIVAVSLTPFGTLKEYNSAVKVNSGNPTSNGIPIGTDFMPTKIPEITSIALQLI
jgi:hypothetical protein